MSIEDKNGVAASEQADSIQANLTEILDLGSTGRSLAIMLALGHDTLQTTNDIDGLIQRNAANAGVGQPVDEHYAYSVISRAPSSLVNSMPDEATSRYAWLYGFTEHGRSVGLPFFARTSKLAWENDIAPAHLVGMTSSRKTTEGLRSNFLRLSLYASLLALDGSITPRELADKARMHPRTLQNHTNPLIAAGILEPEFNGRRTEYPTYDVSLKEDEALDFTETKFLEQKKALARRILNGCAELEFGDAPLSVPTIRESLEATGELPIFFESKSRDRQNMAIASILEFLAEQGFLIEAEPGREQVTAVRLSTLGEAVVNTYLRSIVADAVAPKNDMQDVGERIAQEFVADAQKFTWLMTVDQEKGAITPKKSMEERLAEIRAHLEDGELSTVQLQRLTGLKLNRVHNLLQAAEQRGSIIRRTSGRHTLWSRAAD